MKWIPYILFLALSTLLNAQQEYYVDSLKQVLSSSTSDSLRIQLYGKIAWAYINTRVENEKARAYADSIRQLAETKQNEYAFARYHFYAGVIDRLENRSLSGLDHFHQYVAYQEKQGDSTRVARGLFHIAILHNQLGNLEKSIHTHFRVLQIQQSQQDSSSMAYTLQSIGTLYFELKRYEEALIQQKQALALFQRYNYSLDKANTHLNLGNTYLKLDSLEQAKSHYEQALGQYEELDNRWGIALTQANLAFYYEKLGQNARALDYHQKALKNRESLPQREEYARSLLAVGRGYRLLKRTAEAKSYFQQAQTVANEIRARTILRDIYDNFAELYAASGDYSQAYQMQQQYHALQDSLLNESTNEKLSSLQTQFEAAQKNERIQLLTKENEIQQQKAQRDAVEKRALWGGLGLLGIILGLIWYTYRQRLKNQQALAAQSDALKQSQYREELQQLEMKALRAQMNPHFLFNSLNSINTLILSDENTLASRYLTKFSKLVRLMLENSEHSKVSLQDELDMLEAYIQLEALRFENKLSYSIQVDETLDPDQTEIPSMVLQPFVENAIWHGLLHSEHPGTIDIHLKEEADSLWCSISDNGIGREKSLSLKKAGEHKKKSLGIKITGERLRLLTQQKIEELISIIDLKDERNQALGTQVHIQIPL